MKQIIFLVIILITVSCGNKINKQLKSCLANIDTPKLSIKKSPCKYCNCSELDTINNSNSYPEIDPTGIYELDETWQEGEDVYGYYSSLEIIKIDAEKAFMSFNTNKGAPSYNMGCIIDTLCYINNKVIYTTSDDPTCRITFTFDKKGVSVYEESESFGCGFGHGVVAHGYLKKIKTSISVIRDPWTGEEIYKNNF